MEIPNTIIQLFLHKFPKFKEEESEFYLDIQRSRKHLYNMLNVEQKKSLNSYLFHLREFYEEKERIKGGYALSLGVRIGQELEMWYKELDKII